MFPNTDPAHLAMAEDAIRSEMENGKSLLTGGRLLLWVQQQHVKVTVRTCFILCATEEQDLVKKIVAMSTRERTRAIRELQMSLEEKKHIRWVTRSQRWSNSRRDCR